MKAHKRRKFLSGIFNAGIALTFPILSRNSFAQKIRAVPTSPPFWGGIGFNGNLTENRFILTRQYLSKKNIDVNDSQALIGGANDEFLPLTRSIAEMLSKYGDKFVQFKKEKLQIGEGFVLGMATDYELAVAVKKFDTKNPNTKIGFMTTYISGTGLVVSFDESVGWRVVSSFSWMTRQEQIVDDYFRYREYAVDKLMGNYLQHGKEFVEVLGKFKNWREGYSGNTFAQVISSTIGEKAQPKLKSYKVDDLLTSQYLGFATSDSICQALNIPLIPFVNSDATSRTYSAKFSSIDVKKKIETPPIDLAFEINLVDVTKEVVDSRGQYGFLIIDRSVILSFRVFEIQNDGKNKLFQSFIGGTFKQDKISLPVDDVPERDFYFFDKIIQSTLNTFLSGISTKDKSKIDSVILGKTDALMPLLVRFDELCSKL